MQNINQRIFSHAIAMSLKPIDDCLKSKLRNHIFLTYLRAVFGTEPKLLDLQQQTILPSVALNTPNASMSYAFAITGELPSAP